METEGNYKEEGIHDGNQKEEQKTETIELKIFKGNLYKQFYFSRGSGWEFLDNRLKEKREEGKRIQEEGRRIKNRRMDNEEEKGTEELGF